MRLGEARSVGVLLLVVDAILLLSIVETRGDAWVASASVIAHLLFACTGAFLARSTSSSERWMGGALAAALPLVGPVLWICCASRQRAQPVDFSDAFSRLDAKLDAQRRSRALLGPPGTLDLLTFDGLFSSHAETRRRVLEALVAAPTPQSIAALEWARMRATGQLLLEIGAVLETVARRAATSELAIAQAGLDAA